MDGNISTRLAGRLAIVAMLGAVGTGTYQFALQESEVPSPLGPGPLRIEDSLVKNGSPLSPDVAAPTAGDSSLLDAVSAPQRADRYAESSTDLVEEVAAGVESRAPVSVDVTRGQDPFADRGSDQADTAAYDRARAAFQEEKLQRAAERYGPGAGSPAANDNDAGSVLEPRSAPVANPFSEQPTASTAQPMEMPSDADYRQVGNDAGSVEFRREPAAAPQPTVDDAYANEPIGVADYGTASQDAAGESLAASQRYNSASQGAPQPQANLASQPTAQESFAPVGDSYGYDQQPLAAEHGSQPLTPSGAIVEEPARVRQRDLREPAAMTSPRVASQGRAMNGIDVSPVEPSEPMPMQSAGATPSLSRTGVAGTGRPGERALDGPQRASVVIQKQVPQEVQVGKKTEFRLKVRNVSNRPAKNILVIDQVPLGMELVEATPQAAIEGDRVVWEVDALLPGEEKEMSLELMPVSEGELGSVATVSYTTEASARTTSTMPQLALRMKASKRILVGETQRINIEIHNPGTGDATGVMIFENVPEELRHAAGDSLEFEVGTLPAGQTRTLELVMQAEKAGRVVNRLAAQADGNLHVEQQVEFEVIAPGLELAVDGPSLRYLERPATYQVRVLNPGTAAAKDIELVTRLPKAMKFVRANNLGEYDANTHSVYWSLAELPEGEAGTVELVAVPVEAGDHRIEVSGKAERGLVDQVDHQVSVDGLAAIMFEVVDLEDPIEIGGETTYEIRVVNQGTKAANNVVVRARVPQGLHATDASGQTRHVMQQGMVQFDPIANLPPKAEAKCRIQVQGVATGDQRILVEVNADGFSQPIRKEESTRVYGDR